MNWNQSRNKQLVSAILSLESPLEARNFLRDLMTEGEIDEFAKRLQAAEMLLEGVSYTQIVEKTGLSTTTVARVGKWLKQGKGGYRTIIARLHHRNPIQVRSGLS